MDKEKAVIELKAQDVNNAVKKHDALILCCYAPWCPDCHVISPVIEQLAKDNLGKITFAKMNMDKSRDFTEEYEIQAVPTLLFFKQGKVVVRKVEPAAKVKLLQDEIDKCFT